MIVVSRNIEVFKNTKLLDTIIISHYISSHVIKIIFIDRVTVVSYIGLDIELDIALLSRNAIATIICNCYYYIYYH